MEAFAAAEAWFIWMILRIFCSGIGSTLKVIGLYTPPPPAAPDPATATAGVFEKSKSDDHHHHEQLQLDDTEDGGDDNDFNDDSNDDSYTVAGITLARRAESQVVWAKLPGHPFWPGLRVDLEPGTKDVVPPETLAMRKEHEALVIFFGENSFGWVREDQVLDFKDFYAEKAREPIRNKARFNAALAEALRDVERRDDGFVPPAVHPRGRAGRHGRDGDHHAHGGAKEKSGSDKKEESNPKEKESSAELAERGGDGVENGRARRFGERAEDDPLDFLRGVFVVLASLGRRAACC